MRAALGRETPPLTADVRYHTELVFEEIVGNILRYGSPQGTELRIDVRVKILNGGVTISIEDDGVAFDPCSSGTAPVPRTLEGPDGGFGLRLVRSAARTMHYERIAQQRNRLIVTLSAREETSAPAG